MDNTASCSVAGAQIGPRIIAGDGLASDSLVSMKSRADFSVVTSSETAARVDAEDPGIIRLRIDQGARDN